MNRRAGLLLLWFAFSIVVHAQKKLAGRVVGQDAGKGVALANVFLATTSIGTLTNDRGDFVINQLPDGNYDLVVSCIGYETYTQTIRSRNLPVHLLIELKPKVETLQEVIVSNNERNGWEKWGRFFIEHFIGTSVFAEDVTLLNKETLLFNFNRQTNKLSVKARERLLIENRALGYLLKYDLTRFEYDTAEHTFIYGGFPFFEELKPKNPAMLARWQKNRLDAFHGSLLHFMRSLYADKLEKEGFEVRPKILLTIEEKDRARKIYDALQMMTGAELAKYNNRDSINYYKLAAKGPVGSFIVPDPPLHAERLVSALDSTARQFHFTGKMEVRFPAKRFPREYGRSALGMQYGVNSISQLQGMPVFSDITLDHEKPIIVFANGSHADGINLINTYYWAWWEKMANILPYDYQPVETR